MSALQMYAIFKMGIEHTGGVILSTPARKMTLAMMSAIQRFISTAA